jgi:hypothetical protein
MTDLRLACAISVLLGYKVASRTDKMKEAKPRIDLMDDGGRNALGGW